MRAVQALVVAVVGALIVLAAPPASAKPNTLQDAHELGLAYLARQGGEGPYPEGLAAYAVEAADAAGLDPTSWPDPSRPALASVVVPGPEALFLHLVRPAYAAALAGRLHDWNGEDLGARLRAGFDGMQFGDPALLNDDVYAALAFVADGATSTDPDVGGAVRFLVSNQNGDGGWSYAVGGTSGTDTTAMVLLLLLRSGATEDGSLDAVADRAVAFILSAQVLGEGFAEEPGGDANCDSTAWALRVYLRGDAMTAWPHLLALQNEDGGFAYQTGQPSNALCTVEAVILLGDALSGRTDAPILDDRPFRESPATAVVAAVVVLLLAAAGFRRI